MSRIKEKYGKYFEFKNTTNGKNYFLRGLAGALFLIPMAIIAGIGLGLMFAGAHILGIILVIIGSLVIIPYFWFALATTYKRINAFFPEYAGKILIATFIVSFIAEFFNPMNQLNIESGGGSWVVWSIFGIPQILFSLYLLFGNSKVKNHIG
jgi:hypothetical protein